MHVSNIMYHLHVHVHNMYNITLVMPFPSEDHSAKHEGGRIKEICKYMNYEIPFTADTIGTCPDFRSVFNSGVVLYIMPQLEHKKVSIFEGYPH